MLQDHVEHQMSSPSLKSPSLRSQWHQPAQLLWHSHILCMEKDGPANILLCISSTPYPPPLPTMGKDSQGDCISPFPSNSRKGSTQISISQRMTSFAMPGYHNYFSFKAVSEKFHSQQWPKKNSIKKIQIYFYKILINKYKQAQVIPNRFNLKSNNRFRALN